MLENSILGKLYFILLRFFSFFNESVTHKILHSITEFIKKIYRGSIIAKFIECDDKINYYARRSKILKMGDKIILPVIIFFSDVYKKIRKKNSESINNKIYEFLHEKFHLTYTNIVGIVIVIMLIIPGHKWNNMYGLIMAVMLMGLYVLTLLSGKPLSYKLSKFDFVMLLFILSSVIGIIISYAVSDSIRVFMFFVTSYLFMMAVSGSIKTEQTLHTFVGIISVGLMLTSLYCIYQGIVGVPVDVRLTDVVTNSGMPGRAYSTFENPNNYAEYLVMFMPFYGAFALNQKTNKRKVCMLLLLVIPFAALLYTYSRSCWVSFAISAFVFMAFYNYKLIPLFLFCGVVMIPFLPDTIMNRILTIGSMNDSSNFYRILIWSGVLRMLKNNFVTGIGLGPKAFNAVYPMHADISAITAPHSHMLFMEVLTEMGILGLISLLLFWILSLKRLVKVRKNSEKNNTIKLYSCAALASLSGVIFVSGVEYIWFYPRVMVAFFIMVGLVMAINNLKNNTKNIS